MFFVETEVKCQWTVLVGYLIMSTNVITVIKQVLGDNICLSATQRMGRATQLKCRKSGNPRVD